MRKEQRRPRAAVAPVVVRTEMTVDNDSEPTLADIQWRADVRQGRSGPSLEAIFTLDEDGSTTLLAAIAGADKDKVSVTFIDGVHCERHELVALARALMALAERVEAEHAAAAQRLVEWRRRYEQALEPIDLAASAT